jgi:hypothetical protein
MTRWKEEKVIGLEKKYKLAMKKALKRGLRGRVLIYTHTFRGQLMLGAKEGMGGEMHVCHLFAPLGSTVEI